MTLILSLMLLVQSDEITNLRDASPLVRRAAITMIAEKRIESAIRPLIELLMRETDDSVRNAAVDALDRMTGAGRTNGPDYAKWQKWWDEEGRRRFANATFSEASINQRVEAKIKEVDDKTKEAKNEIRILSITVAIIATAF